MNFTWNLPDPSLNLMSELMSTYLPEQYVPENVRRFPWKIFHKIGDTICQYMSEFSVCVCQHFRKENKLHLTVVMKRKGK